VATLLREAETRATTLLRTNLDKLGRVVDLLLERETIDGSDLAAIAGTPERHGAPEMTWAPRAVAMTPAEAEHDGTSAANGKAAPVS
jgi:cell division protease FtsH